MKLKNLTPLVQAWAGQFFHALWLIGEGRCSDARDFKVSDYPLDNVDPDGNTYEDSLMLYGFARNDEADDSDAVTAGELTEEQQKQAIGSAESRAVFFRTTLEQYANDPYLLNNATGDGISRDGFALARTRIEAELPEDTDVTGECIVQGLYVRKADGTWTTTPNPVDVDYYFWMNRTWGAGLDPSEFLDTSSYTAESTYCDEVISPTQTMFGDINGTVDFGPDEGLTPVETEAKNWIAINNVYDQTLFGAEIEITEAGKEQTHTIISSSVEWLRETLDDPELSGNGGSYSANAGDDGYQATVIKIDSSWTAGKIPVSGDTFTIRDTPTAGISRYKANGKLGDGVVDALSFSESILENCYAGHFLKDGKIAVFCRQEVNLTEVNTYDTITDEGADQNVVYRQGSYGWEPAVDWKPDKDPPNEVVYEYLDTSQDYDKKTRSVRSSVSQLRRATDLGYDTRDKNEKTISLGLCSSLDQATRVASLVLREYGQRGSGDHNGDISLRMPFRHGLDIEIGDVRPLSLTRLPAWIAYGRIEDSGLDPNTWQWRKIMRPHVNDNFDDTADDKAINEIPQNTGAGSGQVSFKIESLTEGNITNSEGFLVQGVTVRFTLPT
jgi:hypothetical protein